MDKSNNSPRLLHAFSGYEVMQNKDGSLYLRKGAKFIAGVTSTADAKKLVQAINNDNYQRRTS